METKKQKVLREWVRLQKRKKVESYVSQELEVLEHLRKQSKWIVIAYVFDLIHYNIYPLFAEEIQLYVYDATQSITILLYAYAIYKLMPKQILTMHFICSAWLWFSIGDTVSIVYDSKTLEYFDLEHVCLFINVLIFSYKFYDELYLRYEILMCRIKLILI